jgi:hypothetical protein
MKKTSTSLLTPLALLACSAFAAAQEDEPKPGPERQPPDSTTMTTVTDMERLFRAYGVMQGGRENLSELNTLSFRLVPYNVTEEGELEQPPMSVTVKLRGTERAIRLEEELDERHAVKIVDGLGAARTWLDGEEREIPELMRDAAQEAMTLFRLLDLLYYPESADFKSAYDGFKTRGGVEYHTAQFEFHPSRLDPFTYRQFFHPETGLVMRIDVHDRRTQGNLRVYSIYLSEYHPVGDGEPEELLKFPGRVRFESRDGTPLALWRWVDVRMNPDVDSRVFRDV